MSPRAIKLSRTFKRSLTKDALGTALAITAAQAAELSSVRALRVLDVLQEERSKIMAVTRMGPGQSHTAEKKLNEVDAAQDALAQGLLHNLGVRFDQNRMAEHLRRQTECKREIIWNDPRERIDKRLSRMVGELEKSYPDYFRLQMLLYRGVDLLLIREGLIPMKSLWAERRHGALTPPLRPLERRIKIYGHYTPKIAGFQNDVIEAVRKMPQFMRQFLDEQGYNIRIGDRLGLIDPDYAQKTEAFEGRSYEARAVGVHVNNSRDIDLPLYNRSRSKDGQGWISHEAHVDSNDLEVTIGHEIFHGIDRFLDYFSQNSKAFVSSYEQDLALIERMDLNKWEAGQLNYYLPKRLGGRHGALSVARCEAFCEVGAERALVKSEDSVSPYFSACAVHQDKLVQSLQIVYSAYPDPLAAPEPHIVRKQDDLRRRPTLAFNS